MTSDSDMDRSYFESMYRHDSDPWGFDTRFYEQRKYALTVAALTRPLYRSAFEPGCANGALTELLAPRCERLTACDLVDETVDRARERLGSCDHVEVVCDDFPAFWPEGFLDLVVWSEVAYYLGRSSLDSALQTLGERLETGGDLVVVNYTGATNYPHTADEVDDRIERSGIVRRHTGLRCEQFRLDVWRR